jgi:3-methyladenine DNA glycosylase/8-oxoguanine DNA glycosylase
MITRASGSGTGKASAPNPLRERALGKRASCLLRPTSPFHFDGTFHKPSHFPAPLEAWEPGRYWRSLRIDDRLYGVRICDAGSTRSPALRVSVFSDREVKTSELMEVRDELIWRFDLYADLDEFEKLGEKDSRFGRVFRRWRGSRDSCANSLYELIVIAVLLQNATVRRTVQMMDSLLRTFGTHLTFDSKSLFAMWRPRDLASVPEQRLRSLKLGYRARFLKRLSSDFARHIVDEAALRAMDVPAAGKELMQLYGVGPETARILLYPACHRYFPLAHIAPWQQKIYSRLFYAKALVPAGKIAKDLNQTFGQYATLAVHYAWEDLFWRHSRKPIPWLKKEIRL